MNTVLVIAAYAAAVTLVWLACRHLDHRQARKWTSADTARLRDWAQASPDEGEGP